jgi:diguanylate cyclase (GGDEF)-like protein/PAS domain S-box-containing protein
MNFLDIRTILFSYAISNAIAATAMFLLWKQNRKRSPELIFWLADFILLFIALLALLMRGIIPEGLSIMLGYPLVLGGTILLYIGLERYTGKRSSQWHNLVLLLVFIALHAYFAFVQPDLGMRDIIFTLGLLVFHGQCAWLLLWRVELENRPTTRATGLVWVTYIAINLTKLYFVLTLPPRHSLFTSGFFDNLVAVCYQMLTIILTYALVLMVNRRLFIALEIDIEARKLAEAALKKSEEKFSKAFQSSPDMVLITSLVDGKIIEANGAFFRITEFTKEETLGKTTGELNLWENLNDRAQYIALLQQQGRIQNFEKKFRKKSGEFFTGLLSGEIIDMQGTRFIITILHDITQRKKIEDALLVAKQQAEAANSQLKEALKREEKLSRTDSLTGVLNRGRFFELAMFEFNISNRYDQPLTILMLDIDHFKQVNDRYGHSVGDLVLQAIAAAMEKELRSADKLGRYGGEEFIILLPVTNMDQAFKIAERLLTKIRALKVNTNQGVVQVTISLGLAMRSPTDDSVGQLIDRADQALYRAKQSGRDRIVVKN